MTLEQWETKILQPPGAETRVQEIEKELRLATNLTTLREQAGMSQRQLAEQLGVSQPRVAAIEKAQNITIDVLQQYVTAVGGELEITVLHENQRTLLLPPTPMPKTA